MNKNIKEIIDFITTKDDNTKSAFIEHGEKLLNENNSCLDFFSYIITHYDNFSEINVECELDFRSEEDAVIRLRTMGNIQRIGTINKQGIASINNISFPVTDEFKSIGYFDLSDQIIKILYVPSKGLYRIRISGLGNTWIARVIRLYSFSNKEKDLNIKSIVTNEFNIYFLNPNLGNQTIMLASFDEDFSNINEMNSLDSKLIHPKILLNDTLLHAVNELPNNMSDFNFKLFPTFQLIDGEWTLNLIYRIYIVTKSFSELLSFIENNRLSLDIPFFQEFYPTITNTFNIMFKTNIQIDTTTDLNEVRKIMHLLDY